MAVFLKGFYPILVVFALCCIVNEAEENDVSAPSFADQIAFLKGLPEGDQNLWCLCMEYFEEFRGWMLPVTFSQGDFLFGNALDDYKHNKSIRMAPFVPEEMCVAESHWWVKVDPTTMKSVHCTEDDEWIFVNDPTDNQGVTSESEQLAGYQYTTTQPTTPANPITAVLETPPSTTIAPEPHPEESSETYHLTFLTVMIIVLFLTVSLVMIEVAEYLVRRRIKKISGQSYIRFSKSRSEIV